MDLQALVVPILGNIKDFTEKIDQASKKGSEFQNNLSKAGAVVAGGGFALAGMAIGGATLAIKDSIESTIVWGETLDGIGDILGTSSSESAGLALVTQRVGGNVDTLTKSMQFMAKGLTDAEGNLGPTGKALDSLGISLYDANGNMRSSVDIFSDVSNVIGNLPEGLERTALVTEILGKSGNDLGDVLNEVANTGMQTWIDQAEQMGLAIDSDKVIEAGKQQQEYEATLKGLKTTLASSLIPVLGNFAGVMSGLLSNPAIKTNLEGIGTAIANFATIIITNIPLAITIFSNIFNFLKEHEGIIIGILVALGVAVWSFVSTTVIPAATATITALAPVILPLVAIGAAVALLYELWDQNFLGIKDATAQIWANLQPVFNTLKEWLQTNIPVALKWLSDTWNNVLLPAIKKVWEFLNTSVFPLLKSIAEFVKAVFSLAFTALAGLWQNVLLPAIKKLYEWLNDKVFPILQKVGNWVKDKISPAFEGLKGVLSSVTDWFGRLTDKISNIKLPKWLTPGSPFPFTNALVGLNEELARSANQILPQFSAQLSVGGSMPIPTYAGSGAISNDVLKAIQSNSQKSFSRKELKDLGRYIVEAMNKTQG